MKVREAFVQQGEACVALGSPFMGRLMPLLAERLRPRNAVAERVLEWEGDPTHRGDSVPLRLAGALHALKLDGLALVEVYPPNEVDDDRLWDAVEEALVTRNDRLLDWLKSPPQTNEVRRAAALLPALAHIHARYEQPVELLELGASAGLNLRADQFRMELPGASFGPATSPLLLAPEWTGPVPSGDLPPVVARRGVDLSPIDPLHPKGRLRLLAYIWPDQPDRAARTEAAIQIAQHLPVTVDRGDAAVWVEAALSEPAPDRLRVLFHTVAWQYFPQATRDRALAAMAACPSPLVRISMEADGGKGAALTLTHFPTGTRESLGRVDFHGRWVSWCS